MSISNGHELENNPHLTGYDEVVSPEKADYNKFIATIHDLTSSGIGNDPLIKDAYAGLWLHSTSSSTFIEMMQQARIERSSSTEYPLRRIHAALIFLYGLNYIQMFELGHDNYPNQLGLNSPQDWQSKVLQPIEDNQELSDKLSELLISKDLMTSDPNRGVYLPFVVRRVLGDEPFSVADLGSSMGFPWARVLCDDCEDSDPFECDDQTSYSGENQLLLQAAKRGPLRGNVTLIDHTDPKDDIPWFVSCRYPKDVNPEAIAKTHARIEKYDRDNFPNIEFRKGNIVSNPPLDPSGHDIVTAIMSGYESPFSLQQVLTNEVLPQAQNLQIVHDYVEVDPNSGELLFTNDRYPYSCATAVRGEVTNNEWLILFRHSNSRAAATANGEDLPRFMETTARLPHNQ